jgi:hypothetical protein
MSDFELKEDLNEFEILENLVFMVVIIIIVKEY